MVGQRLAGRWGAAALAIALGACGTSADPADATSRAKTPDAKPEAKTPEAKTPEAKTPEAKTPEAKTPEAKTPEVKTPEAKTPEAKVDPAGCEPAALGLEKATVVATWTPPTGCDAKSSAADAPETVRSEDAFKKVFTCREGVASGVDFAKHDLVVDVRTLSPAGAGTSIFDDGTRVTLVSRFRNPCVDAPMPMPMPYTLAFLLPAKSTRTYAETTCNLPKSCP